MLPNLLIAASPPTRLKFSASHPPSATVATHLAAYPSPPFILFIAVAQLVFAPLIVFESFPPRLLLTQVVLLKIVSP
jgi:hypothetical protein